MGFPLVCYCMAIPKPLIAFFNLLAAIRDAIHLMLFVVGICHLPADRSATRRSPTVDSPQPDEVKERLPPVEFAQLAAERSSSPCECDGDDGDEAAACIVCLERLQATDEVRRLGNCVHAFHRGCIDQWIDLGRETCPLCRSHLMPRARAGPRGRLGRLASRLRLTRAW
ncbi:hypothetical protein GUJ93_ZPchr0006g44399 [Zizania palustris]|uniref:RING-type domain-containing protein n=1 Tax=Zizania palustris TaxID=103762 RepID=A0A8J5VI21_ZIZPA|nr:hypothetical protein GUJ93_ZPchr0006g46031 [Zizania palustris]KAG8071875.1 hypothetical protein GUJ93_ZPchr0006g44399 [Zizania palustris]